MSAPAGSGRFEPTDWYRIHQIVLMNCPGLKPREFDDLTISEITLIISDPHEPRPHGGRGTNMSAADICESLALWRAMKPRERLEWIRANG